MTSAPTPPADTPSKPLIEFPCDFPIKVMGLNEADFVATMVAVVRVHAPDFDASTVVLRESSGGKYQGLTMTVTATSQAHLDDIYRALTGHPLSKYVL